MFSVRAVLRGLTPVLLALCLAALSAALGLRHWWQAPLPVPEDGLLVQVSSGDTLGQLSARLSERGVIRYPRLFNWAGRLSGADQRIRQGEYRLSPGVTAARLLALLQSDATVRYLVTLPEGIRLAEAIAILRRSEGLTPLLSGSDDRRLLQLLDERATAEGFFLPETYQYERGDSDFDVLVEAHRLMREALHAAWSQREPGLPYENAYEALIMASIIEKETGLANERPLIGGVFVRRLQRRMRLQTDPTVIYGLGPDFDGNLRREHLRDDSNPYNSYRHRGLPPGPIALPGRAALMAAVQPAPGNSLYFVARGDGSHEFSATLAAHKAAVRRYQLNRRADYRSTPALPR